MSRWSLAVVASLGVVLAVRARRRQRPARAAQKYEFLESQVGGHLRSEGKKGMLRGDGTVLKPWPCNERGKRELAFYEALKASQRDPRHPLRGYARFVPRYLGLEELQEEEGLQPYLVLSDETRRFRRPCLVDLKMGTQTYEPDAGDEKREKELAKYPPQQALGYRFVGMRVYAGGSDGYRTWDRMWGRSLTEETAVSEGFRSFLTCPASGAVRADVVPGLVKRLREMLAWFESSTALVLISSSILLMYDGDAQSGAEPHAVMIDFAHARLSDGVPDAGLIKGIRNMIEALESFAP